MLAEPALLEEAEQRHAAPRQRAATHAPAAPGLRPAPLPVLRVGLIGAGTVAGGVCRLLARNQALIGARAGRAIAITAIATRSPARAAPLLAAHPGARLLPDPLALAHAGDVDVVLELAGGVQVPLPWLLAALEQGKHVVTANKALLARHGAQLAAAAARHGRVLAYEAAVAGGVPVVKALREALVANRIEALAGILNGTSNFILTRMAATGASYGAALAEAQALGYAEADPQLDVGGQDAAYKLALLAANAFDLPVRDDAVHVEGIAGLEPGDLAAAAHLGCAVRLLALAQRGVLPTGGETVQLRVHPALVPLSHPLAQVQGVHNALLVHADAAGPLLLSGAGAGAEPTASAVVADLADLARSAGHPAAASAIPTFGVARGDGPACTVAPMAQVRCRQLLRVVPGKAFCEASAVRLLARAGIAVRQRAWAAGAGGAPELLLLTQAASDAAAHQAAQQLQACSRATVRRLRMYDGQD